MVTMVARPRQSRRGAPSIRSLVWDGLLLQGFHQLVGGCHDVHHRAIGARSLGCVMVGDHLTRAQGAESSSAEQ